MFKFLKKIASFLGIIPPQPEQPPASNLDTPSPDEQKQLKPLFKQKFVQEKETILLSNEPFKKRLPPPPSHIRSVNKTTIEVTPPKKKATTAPPKKAPTPPPKKTIPQPPPEKGPADFTPIPKSHPPGPRPTRCNISFSPFDDRKS